MKATLSGFGTPVDVVISTLGTNDASRPGYRGRGFATNMAQLISNIQNDFPGTKFINWLPPASTSGSTWNTAMTTIVSAMSALAVGNVYAPNLNTLGIGSGNASIISADGIHLSQYGYSLTASLYAGQIGSALGLLY
jgi:lysophospholipase L1-like esterase